MEQPKNNLKVISEKKNVRMILPNMLTLIGVCIGLTSIRFSFNGQFDLAIIAIIFAALIDGLDGRIARLIKGTSKVGKELDSLTDMISFGVAPAFIMYFWTLSSLGRLGWLICLIYVICVALRLARFNINSNQEPSWRDNFFEGVPSPAGGILVLTPLVISMTNFNFVKIDNNIIVPIFFIVTSLLLISKFPTYSFKKIVIQRQTTIFLLFGIVLFFGFILIYPFIAISISVILYLLMLPISYFHYNKLKKQNADKPNLEDDDFEDIL
ncbi:phosphatidylserine synthase [Candidatus Pelagibacter sp. HTCC7211]|uniref:CDP-diacylglycerol--serine O-phosphatidyltransferase n=1 Tax=Pelagibacter sp. (strain HTCC7211) TaxID=439493 RepID=UPI0001839406|nr:CDP-diacylglycerol--serine O-phosphatidyltransferase [Candidatus Pelagibacter sp. HTCC7211]EDZ60699.1 phosphatidylserine synthase [Candidatus Pelagibacter sp. HTCC7211]